MSSQCSLADGQCECHPNMAGQRCDRCNTNYAGFEDGCKGKEVPFVSYLVNILSSIFYSWYFLQLLYQFEEPSRWRRCTLMIAPVLSLYPVSQMCLSPL